MVVKIRGHDSNAQINHSRSCDELWWTTVSQVTVGMATCSIK